MERERGPIEYGELEGGRHCNYWRLDRTLRREARQAYAPEEFEWAEPRLDEFGAVVGNIIADNADLIDDHGPELHTYDKHGNVQNHVEYHPKQTENERLTYERGVVADAFTPPHDRDEPVGLVHTLTMQALLSYADAGFVCPVSMTAGAALVLANHDDGSLEDYFQGLTAREMDDHVEGAMFLTEKQGGSDVGANETVAERADDGTYRLTGEKWFCSNIDAEGTLVLARRPDAPEGTAGLSLFLVPHTLPDGSLNHAVYRRLKDKLGTVSVPTGEVEFRGAVGHLVGEPERGFRYMTTMLNYERVTNATGAVGIMGRALLESKVRAATREAFGAPIQEHPLMRRDLVEMAVDYEAAATFTFEAARQFDRYEADRDGDETAFKLMRVLVPVAKHRTARMAVDTASYAMEILGGNGYVDDFVTNRLLRDAQVLPIWEGTSNVLSLDLLRALERERAHEALFPAIAGRLDAATDPLLEPIVESVRGAFTELRTALGELAAAEPAYAQLQAKELADLVFDVVAASLLVERAQSALDDRGDARLAVVADWFATTRFETREARGIVGGSTVPLDHFDAVVRYAPLDPDDLSES